MRRSFTALIALILALSMLLGIFASCTNKTPDTDNSTDASTDGATEKPTEKPTDDGKEEGTDDPGKDDPVVPVSHSIDFFNEMQTKYPTAKVFLDVFDGGHQRACLGRHCRRGCPLLQLVYRRLYLPAPRFLAGLKRRFFHAV